MKKLYFWGNDSECGYAVCDDSEMLSDETCNYEYDITRYSCIGKFRNRNELIQLLQREGEDDAEFWANVLLKTNCVTEEEKL